MEEWAELKTLQGANPSPLQVQASKKLGLRAAEAFEKSGDLRRAYEVYMKSDHLSEAASVMERLGELRRAGDLYRDAGKVDRAIAAMIASKDYEGAIALFDELDRPEEIPKLLRMAGRNQEA